MRQFKSKLIVFSCLALIVVGAVFIYEHWFNLPANRYTYKKLDSYTLRSGSKETDLTFQKPAESKVNTLTNQVFLIHQLVNGSLSSYINAVIIPLATPLSSYDNNIFSKTLADPSNKYYAQTVAPIKKYIQGQLPPKINFSASNAKTFNNPNIHKNAWRFDFTATQPSTNKKYSGSTIYATTDNGYYFFTVYTPNTNWKHNSKIWNQILNSLKPS